MNILFKGNVLATQAMKDFTSKKVSKLTKYTNCIKEDSILTVTVTKNKELLHVHLDIDHQYFADVDTHNFYGAFDDILPIITGQLRREKTKRGVK